MNRLKQFIRSMLLLALAIAIVFAAYKCMPAAKDVNVDDVYEQTTTFIRLSSSEQYYINAIDGALYYKSRYNENDEKLLDDVRSLHYTPNLKTIYALTNSGDLFSWGSNDNGMLGDGTGVDSDIPTLVLKNVSQVMLPTNPYSNSEVQAFTRTGVLYYWGKTNGEIYYEPVASLETDIAYLADFNAAVSKEYPGCIWNASSIYKQSVIEDKIPDAIEKPLTNFLVSIESSAYMKHYSKTQKYGRDADAITFVLKPNGDFVMQKYYGISEELIESDVIGFMAYGSSYNVLGMSYLTRSGDLYSYGEMVGDGTLVPKDDFVKVLSGVKELINYNSESRYVLKSNGDIMGIVDNKYQTILSGISAVSYYGGNDAGANEVLAYGSDGTMWDFFNDGRTELIQENVATPVGVRMPNPSLVSDSTAPIKTFLPVAGAVVLLTVIWGIAVTLNYHDKTIRRLKRFSKKYPEMFEHFAVKESTACCTLSGAVFERAVWRALPNEMKDSEPIIYINPKFTLKANSTIGGKNKNALLLEVGYLHFVVLNALLYISMDLGIAHGSNYKKAHKIVRKIRKIASNDGKSLYYARKVFTSVIFIEEQLKLICAKLGLNYDSMGLDTYDPGHSTWWGSGSWGAVGAAWLLTLGSAANASGKKQGYNTASTYFAFQNIVARYIDSTLEAQDVTEKP